MMSVVDFENGRGFLERYFPYNMADHNAGNYVQAYHSFDTVITQYPQSPYAPDAKRRMIYLNNIMAQYQYKVGEFYFEKQAYVAAANRGLNVLLHYPQSPVVEPALELMLDSYQKLHLDDLATQTAQMLALNFPQNSAAQAFLKAHPDVKVIAAAPANSPLNTAARNLQAHPPEAGGQNLTPPGSPVMPPALLRR